MLDKKCFCMFLCVFLPKLRFFKEKKGRKKRITEKELASNWTKAIKCKKRKTMKRKEQELKVACTPGYSSSTLLTFIGDILCERNLTWKMEVGADIVTFRR